MRVAIAQLNPTLGDLQANEEAMLEAMEVLAQGAVPPELVVFPLGSLTGEPLQGLAWSRAFCTEALEAAADFAARSPLPALISTQVPLYCDFSADNLGLEDEAGEGDISSQIPPQAAEYLCGARELFLCEDGDLLPLGFMDEDVETVTLEFGGAKLGVVMDRFLDDGEDLSSCDVIVSMMAVPYAGASALPIALGFQQAMAGDAGRNNAWLMFANLLGGQGEEVYPGGSFVMSPYGEMMAGGHCFQESIFDAELSFGDEEIIPGVICEDEFSEDEALWTALLLATRDYVYKNGFTDVAVGLSGGIDSALVAVAACDALGPDHVHAVTLPGPFTSQETLEDAEALADNLGIDIIGVPITQEYATMMETLGDLDAALQAPELLFDTAAKEEQGSVKDLTQQNLQARLRTVYIMALSNQYGWMMLNTCNRSEDAVGYSTLYGDCAGSFAPAGSLYKTRLVELLKWRNSLEEVVPASIFDRPPTAELKEGQKDSDNLPPYEELDAILTRYLDEEMTAAEIAAEGFAEETVARVLRMVGNAEFKRRQSPLSPTFGLSSLNSDRDWPSCNQFRG